MEYKTTLYSSQIWQLYHHQQVSRDTEFLSDLLLLLRNYEFLYRTSKNKTKNSAVNTELKILRGLIEHPHLTIPARKRQVIVRYERISRAVLEPPVHKKALRWVFKKLDSFFNKFRKKKRLPLSAYFAPTRTEKLREKLEKTLYNRRRNTL